MEVVTLYLTFVMYSLSHLDFFKRKREADKEAESVAQSRDAERKQEADKILCLQKSREARETRETREAQQARPCNAAQRAREAVQRAKINLELVQEVRRAQEAERTSINGGTRVESVPSVTFFETEERVRAALARVHGGLSTQEGAERIQNRWTPLTLAKESERVQEVQRVNRVQEAQRVNRVQEAQRVTRVQEAQRVNRVQEAQRVNRVQEAQRAEDAQRINEAQSTLENQQAHPLTKRARFTVEEARRDFEVYVANCKRIIAAETTAAGAVRPQTSRTPEARDASTILKPQDLKDAHKQNESIDTLLRAADKAVVEATAYAEQLRRNIFEQAREARLQQLALRHNAKMRAECRRLDEGTILAPVEYVLSCLEGMRGQIERRNAYVIKVVVGECNITVHRLADTIPSRTTGEQWEKSWEGRVIPWSSEQKECHVMEQFDDKGKQGHVSLDPGLKDDIYILPHFREEISRHMEKHSMTHAPNRQGGYLFGTKTGLCVGMNLYLDESLEVTYKFLLLMKKLNRLEFATISANFS